MTREPAPARGARNARWIPLKAGDRFGLYTLVALSHTDTRGQVWNVRCDCGRESRRGVASMRYQLRSGKVPQCAGCGSRQRTRSGAATRSQRQGLAARLGDKRAFAELEPISIDDDLPEW